MNIIRAPFTPEQTESLNGYQHKSYMHPFTCGNGQCRHEHHASVLEATPAGWVCRHCDYTQDWAHCFMADGSWKRHAAAMDEFFRMIE